MHFMVTPSYGSIGSFRITDGYDATHSIYITCLDSPFQKIIYTDYLNILHNSSYVMQFNTDNSISMTNVFISNVSGNNCSYNTLISNNLTNINGSITNLSGNNCSYNTLISNNCPNINSSITNLSANNCSYNMLISNNLTNINGSLRKID